MQTGVIRAFAWLWILGWSVAAAGERTYQGHDHDGATLTVRFETGQVTLTAHHDDALGVHYEQAGLRQLPSFAIAGAAAPTQTRLRERRDRLEFSTANMTAVIHKDPLRIEFRRGRDALLAEEAGFFGYETARGFRFALAPDEKLMGGGQRVLGMDRRGHRLPLYQKASYGYEAGKPVPQMYFGLPAVLSSRGYLLLFDNTATGTMDLGATEIDVMQFDAVAGRTAYLVASGDSYPEIIAAYVAVTGRQPMPPRWALGNYASRFGYHSAAEARDTVRRFAEADFPLDAIVLDLYWFGPDIKGHMGRLDWDRDAFPDPEAMMAAFADAGIRTILVTEPFVLTSSDRWDEAVREGVLARNFGGGPRRFDFYFGNTGLIDVFDDRAAAWFWSIYRGLMDQGVAGWWGDLGEPEVHPADTLHAVGTAEEIHNAYGHRWAGILFENHERDFPDRRPFIMMRSGFAGSQRYGMIPWTGDVARSWGGLQPQVELSLQMGLLGLAWTHSDLGGFAGGDAFDRELYIRWLQYGVFQPVYRPHAQEHIASEPVFHDALTQDILREYVKLRYRLLPYHYTMAWQNSTTGMPLMRPLFFEDESAPDLIDEASAYLWGDAFLVAPVVNAGVAEKTVNLPDGAWFDFWDDARYDGGEPARIATPLERIPVFVRAGAFVPMIEPISTTRDYASDALTLHYYADPTVPSASGLMYDDDGATHRAHERGLFELLRFRAEQRRGRLRISFAREGGDYPGRPRDRDITLVVHNQAAEPKSVRIGDTVLPRVASREALAHSDAGAYYDAATRRLHARFAWDHGALAVTVR